MIRIAIFLILVGALALGAAWLADRPGEVVITWQGMRLETSVMVLAASLLAAVGFDPWNIVESIRLLIQRIWNLGFDAINGLWRYFLLGAVIVIPVWLLSRLFGGPRGR